MVGGEFAKKFSTKTMKLPIFSTCILLSILVAYQHASAQCILVDGKLVQADGSPCANTIITGLPFLRIVPDARFGGMGDAGIALSPDPNSMHFNAANLAFSEKDLSVSATYTPWLRVLGLNDVFMAYLSSNLVLDAQKNRMQSLGMSLRFFSLGQIQYTDEQGNALQTVRPNELELAFAYSRKLGKTFSIGFTPKYIFSNLGNGTGGGSQPMRPVHSFAADVAFAYRKPLKIGKSKNPNANLNFGLVFSNLGPKISYTRSIDRDYIPANLGLGTSFSYAFDEHNSLTIAFDINKLLVPTPTAPTIQDENGNPVTNPEYDNENGDGTGDGEPDYKQKSVPAAIFGSFGDAPGGIGEEFNELMYSIGLEYWYNKQFAIRLGHYNEHATKGGRKFLTVGLGLRYNIFNINFSYLLPSFGAQRSPLDNTIRFSLLFDFDRLSD